MTYPVTQHTLVNGHQAAIHQNIENGWLDARAVTWSADGYAFAVVSETFGRSSVSGGCGLRCSTERFC